MDRLSRYLFGTRSTGVPPVIHVGRMVDGSDGILHADKAPVRIVAGPKVVTLVIVATPGPASE